MTRSTRYEVDRVFLFDDSEADLRKRLSRMLCRIGRYGWAGRRAESVCKAQFGPQRLWPALGIVG